MFLTVQQCERDGAVQILPPVFPISGDRDLPVGPFTGQVDADAGDDCGFMLQAERGEVEAAQGEAGAQRQATWRRGANTISHRRFRLR